MKTIRKYPMLHCCNKPVVDGCSFANNDYPSSLSSKGLSLEGLKKRLYEFKINQVNKSEIYFLKLINLERWLHYHLQNVITKFKNRGSL